MRVSINSLFALFYLCGTIWCRNVVDEDSVCIISGERIEGDGDCTNGEVQLLGDYIKLGIHNAASFGTEARLETSYYNDSLGFIADYDKNGFDAFYVESSTSSGSYYYYNTGTWYPGFAGDYFVPGLPIEGIHNCFIDFQIFLILIYLVVSLSRMDRVLHEKWRKIHCTG